MVMDVPRWAVICLCPHETVAGWLTPHFEVRCVAERMLGRPGARTSSRFASVPLAATGECKAACCGAGFSVLE